MLRLGIQIAVAIFLAFPSTVIFGQDVNLTSNAGFETNSICPWVVSRDQNAGVSNGDFLQGSQAMFIDHLGFNGEPSNFQQVRNVGTGANRALVNDTEYIFSVNARVESGDGQFVLFACFDREPNHLATAIWDVDGATHWQKYQVKFKVPEQAGSVTIGGMYTGPKGRIWVDWTRLYPADSMIQNGDFESS